MSELITVEAAAKTAAVSTKTIRRWIKDGILVPETVKGPRGDEYRLDPEAVMAAKTNKTAAIEIARRTPVAEQAAEISALRQVIEAQTTMIEQMAVDREAREKEFGRLIDELRAEQRDTRGQLHQLHESLLKALPAPSPPPEEKRPRWKFWRR